MHADTNALIFGSTHKDGRLPSSGKKLLVLKHVGPDSGQCGLDLYCGRSWQPGEKRLKYIGKRRGQKIKEWVRLMGWWGPKGGER